MRRTLVLFAAFACASPLGAQDHQKHGISCPVADSLWGPSKKKDVQFWARYDWLEDSTRLTGRSQGFSTGLLSGTRIEMALVLLSPGSTLVKSAVPFLVVESTRDGLPVPGIRVLGDSAILTLVVHGTTRLSLSPRSTPALRAYSANALTGPFVKETGWYPVTEDQLHLLATATTGDAGIAEYRATLKRDFLKGAGEVLRARQCSPLAP